MLGLRLARRRLMGWHLVGAVALFVAVGASSAQAASLSISTSSLPAARQTSTYSTTLAATGGVLPYHWSLASGGLPAGLSLSSTGALTGSPTRVGVSSATFKVTDSASPTAASATRTLSLVVLAPEGQSELYLADPDNSSVTEFAPGANGDATPLAVISGPATGLVNPLAIAVSSTRRVYVTNNGADYSVEEFAPGASGDATPAAAIAGAATALDYPEGIAVDAVGDVWVANEKAATVTEYAPGATGNAAPIATLAGAATDLTEPARVTSDAAGHMWVSNVQPARIVEFAAGAHGNAAPIAVLSSTALSSPLGIAFDSLGQLHVVDAAGPAVLTFGVGAMGSVMPLSSISGTLTGLGGSWGAAIDPAGRLYVAESGGAILGFDFGATGDVAPAISLTGTATRLSEPEDVAISAPAPLALSTASLPVGNAASAYSARLSAAGGVPPYHYSLSSGALPAGLSLSASGAITGTPTSTAKSSVTFKVTDSALPAAGTATRTLALTVLAARGQSTLYVANVDGESVTEYAPGASADAMPLATIAGTATGLNGPAGLAVSTGGKLYVGNSGSQAITEYAPGAAGDAAPTATIAGTATGLLGPDFITLDAAGDIWAANGYVSRITEYAPGANGNVAPLTTLSGSATALNLPQGIAFDAAGHLWVANQGDETVTEYAPGASGNAAPIAALSGSATGLASIAGLAFDSLGDLYIAGGTGSVSVFAPGAHGNATPIAVISGAATGFKQPAGVAVDPAGRLYVGDAAANGLDEFPLGASGDAAPAVSIAGAATGLDFPFGVAVSPPAPLALSSPPLLGAHLDVAYKTQLTATGGVPPYHFVLGSGKLPAGLSLSSSGALTGTPTALGASTVTVKVTDSALPTAAMKTQTLRLAVLAPAGQSVLYVANTVGAIVEYAPGAAGSATPMATIFGAATGLRTPLALVVSASREVYVLNYGGGPPPSITEYPPGASGNVAPAVTISGNATGLNQPTGLARDAAGDLWVADSGSGAVTEYAPGASGNATPVATISGSATGLVTPAGVAIDAAGNVWVVDGVTHLVSEFSPGAHGNIAPVATLSGPATGLVYASGLAFDPEGDLSVTDGAGAVSVFAPGAHGDVAPLLRLAGAATDLSQPYGIAIDPAGQMYLNISTSNAVVEFPFGAGGDVAPLTAISGPDLVAPTDVAVSPPAPVAVSTTSLPNDPVGVAYSASLTATGGVPGYTWSLAGGALPAGLSLSPAGQITGAPTAVGTFTAIFKATDSARPAAASGTRTLTLSVTVAPGVYAANSAGDSVTEYPLSASGDSTPALAISGPNTGLATPESVILDATGRTYVANTAAGTVTEYAPGATGDAAPLTTITGIPSPRALALDSSNDLFVASTNGPISEYAPGASGAATPKATISGQQGPQGLAFDAAGDLFVSEQTTNSINEYAPGASGDATPTATITGPDTGLSFPQALVVDPTGHLTVANAGNASVTINAQGANGDTPPVATLTDGLLEPLGVDRGTDLTVFVGDAGLDAIVEYGPGDAAPSDTITGPHTGLNGLFSVAATPPLSIITTTLPNATLHRPYLVNLQAAEGTTPYRWQLIDGRLPRGLRLTPAGAITGTPHGRHHHKLYHFTVTVTDASHPHQTASQRLTLTLRRRPG